MIIMIMIMTVIMILFQKERWWPIRHMQLMGRSHVVSTVCTVYETWGSTLPWPMNFRQEVGGGDGGGAWRTPPGTLAPNMGPYMGHIWPIYGQNMGHIWATYGSYTQPASCVEEVPPPLQFP